MPSNTSQNISNSQAGFSNQPTGANANCPEPAPVPESRPPVQLEQTFTMTRQIMRTLGNKPPEKKSEKKHWIEIILVDNEGKPMPGVKYRITPPGGNPVEGRLNEHGQAGLYNIDPGNCKITFPDLDQDAWE